LFDEAARYNGILEYPSYREPRTYGRAALSLRDFHQDVERAGSKPNSRELLVIGPRVSNTPKLLKRRVGNGMVHDAEEDSDDVKGVSVCYSYNIYTHALFSDAMPGAVPFFSWRHAVCVGLPHHKWELTPAKS
jgi:hypothetical protein